MLTLPLSRARSGRNLQRERLYSRLKDRPVAGIPQSEVDEHFLKMPSAYWERVNKAELIWGLEVVHAFLGQAAKTGRARATVAADGRHYPERGFTKVMVCAWDEAGLLAKIAASFSALRINILRADVYTRSDGLALDLFEVNGADQNAVLTPERLQHLTFLLEGALCQPPRFVSFWATQFHKALPRPASGPGRVQFENEGEYTLIRVEAPDRVGLLHDLLQGLTDCGLNVAQAIIQTEENLAQDAFSVTDLGGGKIVEARRLTAIRAALIAAVGP